MNEEARKIIGDAAENILTSIIAGIPVPVRRGISRPTTDPGIVAGRLAYDAAMEAGFTKLASDSISSMTDALVIECLDEMRRRGYRGGKAVGVKRTAPDRIEIEFQGGERRGPVPLEVKHEMREMAQAGFTVRDISQQYGYPEPDTRQILKSMKIRAAEAPALPVSPTDTGLTGIDAAAELDVAEALMAGASLEEAARGAGVTPAQAEAVRAAWAEASPVEAAAHVIAEQQHEQEAAATDAAADPIARDEILFCQGAGPEGWRVEIAPALAPRLRRDLEVLRAARVHGSPVTEYDVIFSNIRRFADRNLPASNKRLKSFAWKGTRIQEFKGFQGRVFFGTMKSVYPDGREVWRCGLVMAILKKRDEATNADLEKVIDALAVWRDWRAKKDATIAEEMRGR